MLVKPLSFLVYQDKLGEEFDLWTAVNLTVVDPAVHHGVPLGFANA